MKRELSLLLCLSLFGCGEKEIETETETNQEDSAIEEDYSEYCNGDPEQNLLTEDQDCDGTLSEYDCDDSNPDSTIVSQDQDCDGILFIDDCDDFDVNSNTLDEDGDCDGVLMVDDCDDNDPVSTIVAQDQDCDGVLTEDDCDDLNPNAQYFETDGDCDGVLTEDDCDDQDPQMVAIENDNDCDGVIFELDCDDFDSDMGIFTEDRDCDGVLTEDDCGEFYNITFSTNRFIDHDCDGVLTEDDCDDNNISLGTIAEDGDCDGVLTVDDCDDSDPSNTNVNDLDCDGDGLDASEDCDNQDSSDVSLSGDCDQDGILVTEDCDDQDSTIGSEVDNFYGFVYETYTDPCCGTQIEWQYNEEDVLVRYEYLEDYNGSTYYRDTRMFDESDGSLSWVEQVRGSVDEEQTLYEYDETGNLIYYSYADDTSVLDDVEKRFEYDNNNIVFFSKTTHSVDEGWTEYTPQIRATYYETGTYSSIQTYYEGYWQGFEVRGAEYISFYENGQIAEYRNSFEDYALSVILEKCSFDENGNLLDSSLAKVEIYLGDRIRFEPAGCENGVSFEEPSLYLEEPAPLTDDGTSHTPMELTCAP